MTSRLNVCISLIVKAGQHLEDAASNAIIEYQGKFTPFFERIIDVDDARVTVTEGCLEIENIDISSNKGVADVQFMSSFYAGCKDMNSDDWHEATLEFEIKDGQMIFDIELPRIWRVEQE